MDGNQGHGPGHRHATQPGASTSTKNATSKQHQIQQSLNMQHLYQMQKAKEHHKSSSGLYHTTKMAPTTLKQAAPTHYDMLLLGSTSSTPNQAALQQQRALTQLYQQTAQTPLAGSKGHASLKSQNASGGGAGGKSKGHHHQSASSKKQLEHGAGGTKQVDLQAKFASLLKQSKDLHRGEQAAAGKFTSSAASLPANIGSKQDKKGEKAGRELNDKATVARNQLFGEGSKTSKESQTAKHAKEAAAKQSQQLTMSPARHSSQLRQTPVA